VVAASYGQKIYAQRAHSAKFLMSSGKFNCQRDSGL